MFFYVLWVCECVTESFALSRVLCAVCVYIFSPSNRLKNNLPRTLSLLEIVGFRTLTNNYDRKCNTFFDLNFTSTYYFRIWKISLQLRNQRQSYAPLEIFSQLRARMEVGKQLRYSSAALYPVLFSREITVSSCAITHAFTTDHPRRLCTICTTAFPVLPNRNLIEPFKDNVVQVTHFKVWRTR